MTGERRSGRTLASLGFGLVAALLPAAGAVAQIGWLGPEIPVNQVTTGSQFAPAIAGDGDGSFVVAWQSADVDGSGFGIRARRFEADGTPATAELAVNVVTSGDQITPSVALLDGGAFVVAWASNGVDGSGFGIVARRFAANGGPLSGELALNGTTAGNQLAPRLVSAGGGGFVAIWSGLGAASGTTDLFARGFDAVGNPTVAEFRVNSTVSGEQLSPAIARSVADGGITAVWASEGQDGSGYAVVARRFTSTGTFLTGEIAVPQFTALDQTAPAVAAAGDRFYVAWQRALQASTLPIGPQPIVAFRALRNDGTPLGNETPIHFDTTVRHERPAVVLDGAGNLVFAWRETDPAEDEVDVVRSIWSPAGVALTGEAPIHRTLAGDQIDPVLAAGPAERFVATWSSFGQDGSSFGVFAQRFGAPPEPCVPDAETLCLNDGRFRVRATFATPHPKSGQAQAVALTGDSGYFTFFDPANVEIVVKVLDACSLAGLNNYWVFATGLTNVAVDMTVEDSASGVTRTYRNELNRDFQPILDTGHFQVCDATRSEPSSAPGTRALPVAPVRELAAPATALGSCVPDENSLCLRDGRFEVTIDWTTAASATGFGHATPLSDESGYFWFFNDDNVELVIKVIDGCSSNGRFWIFAGGLTDVGTVLTVRDTAHPEAAPFVRTKPIGTPFLPILTIDGFATCP